MSFVSSRACALGLVLAGLIACAAGPQFRYNVDPSADLRAYRTFGFLDEREHSMVPYQSVAHRHLKAAIRRELQARGLAPSRDPELLINIHLQRKDDAARASSDYYDYRKGQYAWGDGVQATEGNYMDGTLNVDVIDAAKQRLLWEGIAIGSISQRMYENLESTIDAVTAKLFERFPRQPHS